MLMGYVVGEVPLPEEKNPDKSVRIKVHHPEHIFNARRPAGIPFGFWIGREDSIMVARPRPDLYHPVNCISSAINRFATQMPESLGNCILEFGMAFIEKYLPQASSEPVDVSAWLDKSNYSATMKKKILEEFIRNPIITTKDLHYDSFIKAEGYDSYKAPRGIQGTKNKSKLVCGPVQHRLDECVFSTKWSVKHMDVSLRPLRLKELFGDDAVCGTDFSSMEAHFRKDFAKLRYYWKWWVGKNIPGIDDFLSIQRQKTFGTNQCNFRGVSVQIDETLMSGETSTSSDNFVLDLIICMYLIVKTKYGDPLHHLDKCDLVKCLFEGDDGIFEYVDIPQLYIDELGIRFKKTDFKHFGEASFCGIIVDPVAMCNVVNPMKILANIGILSPYYSKCGIRKKMALLRAKALSYANQYINVPIVSHCCDYILRFTRSYSVKAVAHLLDSWEYRDWDKSQRPTRNIKILMSTRQLVSELFGISIDSQLKVEAWFASAVRLQPTYFDLPYPDDWKHFADHYSSFEDECFEVKNGVSGLAWALFRKGDRLAKLGSVTYPVRYLDMTGYGLTV